MSKVKFTGDSPVSEVEAPIDPHQVNATFHSTNPGHKMQVELVSPAELFKLIIDPMIQRTLQETEVENIYRKFNSAALGVLTLSQRTDGTRSVLDGQQRRAVLMRLYNEGRWEQPVTALVHSGLSIQEEAQLFLDLNDRRAVDAVRRFKTRLVAGEAQALDIKAILDELELPISGRGVQAIETIDRLYVQPGGPERVRWVLRMIQTVYDTNRRGGCYDGRVIVSFSMVHAAFNHILDEERFVNALSKISDRISTLHGAGKTKQQFDRGTMSFNMAEVIRRWYNDSRRKNTAFPSKLPEFPRKTLDALMAYGEGKTDSVPDALEDSDTEA